MNGKECSRGHWQSPEPVVSTNVLFYWALCVCVVFSESWIYLVYRRSTWIFFFIFRDQALSCADLQGDPIS